MQKLPLTPEERWRYIASTLGGFVSSPYRLSTTYLPELDSAIRRESLGSRYSTNPYTEIPSSYKRKGVVELLGKWLGLQNRTQYIPPQPKVSPKSMARNRQRYINKLNQ